MAHGNVVGRVGVAHCGKAELMRIGASDCADSVRCDGLASPGPSHPHGKLIGRSSRPAQRIYRAMASAMLASRYNGIETVRLSKGNARHPEGPR